MAYAGVSSALHIVTSWINFVECVYTYMYVHVYIYVFYIRYIDFNGILKDTY